MMTDHFARSAPTTTVTLALSLLVLIAARPTVAEAASSCAQRLDAARSRSLARVVRCLARTKSRDGAPAARCIARARLRSSASTTGVGACPADVPALERAVGTCATAVLSHVPGGGKCAARTLRAVAASLHARTEASRSTTLCRAVDLADGCADDCTALAEALATCWSDAPHTPPQSALPVAAPGERIVLFGAYEAEAIASATVAGQDEVTQTARVVIEQGDALLYVVLASYESIIWRFEGDVSRVAHVVLLGYGRGGVTGVPADRVADPGLASYFYERGSSEERDLRLHLESALGRPVDVVAGSYGVGTLALPAATVTPSEMSHDAPPGFDPWVYVSEGLWFNPGGVVQIDPSAVVSTNRAEAYEVLPEGFGLAQLVASGALEAREGYFYIARAIPRFPAGLYGSHSVTFVLGRGVPMPAGSPGHSCVVSEESGLPLENPWLCHSLPPSSAACAFPVAPPEAQVVLFGAYEGDAMSSVTINGQDEDTGTARVVVEPGTTPIYLVLSAYDDTIWRFEGATSRVDRVVFLGYGAQGATGLPAARVTDLSNTPDTGCFQYFYDVQSPDGVAARSATERALGRQVDVFAGSYDVGTLALPSMTVTPSPSLADVPPGFDPDVFRTEGLRFNPGGIIEIDPSQVVSTVPAESYEVLPQGFGLAQLVAAGALEVQGRDSFTPTFRIARPIPRFPAGLYGAHLVRFILGTGVPMPAGSPGHSCVVSEQTGQPIGNDLACSIFDGL